MQKDDILEKIRDLVHNILRDNKMELVNITYRREGRANVLRILADTEKGITAADCARINEIVGEALDKDDIIGESYLLEVASPGLDRPLKTKADFIREKSKKVRIHTYTPIEGKKEFKGILEGADEENVSIMTEKGRRLTIAFDKISSARLAF